MKKIKINYHHGNLRAALLEEATRIVLEEGIDCVTVRAVCENVGVTRPALYRHFTGKTHLLCTLAEDGFKRLNEDLKHEMRLEPDDSLLRFQGMAVAYVNFAMKNPAFYRLMFGKSVVTRHPTEELQNTARETFNTGLAVLEECREKGMIAGDPLSLINVTWALIHGLSVLMIDGQVYSEKGMHTLLTGFGKGAAHDSGKMVRLAINTMVAGMRLQE